MMIPLICNPMTRGNADHGVGAWVTKPVCFVWVARADAC